MDPKTIITLVGVFVNSESLISNFGGVLFELSLKNPHRTTRETIFCFALARVSKNVAWRGRQSRTLTTSARLPGRLIALIGLTKASATNEAGAARRSVSFSPQLSDERAGQTCCGLRCEGLGT